MRKIAFASAILLLASVFSSAALVQKASNGGFVNSSSAGCSFATPTTPGNLVVLKGFFQSSTMTVTGGQDAGGTTTWNVIGPATGANNRTYVVYGVVVDAFSSPQMTWTGAYTGDIFCTEYSGMASAGSVYDGSSTDNGSGTSLSAASVTPTAANDLIIGIFGLMANSVDFTEGSGYTMQFEEGHSTQGNSAAWEDKTASNCSAQTADMTSNTSGIWSGMTVAFKAASPTSCGSGGSSTPGRGYGTFVP